MAEFTPRKGEIFPATNKYLNTKCELCDIPIAIGELLRYYGGPFLFHESCIQDIFDKI